MAMEIELRAQIHNAERVVDKAVQDLLKTSSRHREEMDKKEYAVWSARSELNKLRKVGVGIEKKALVKCERCDGSGLIYNGVTPGYPHVLCGGTGWVEPKAVTH